MTKLPKISIITPSYNQGQYIEQTICSVLDQNYPNLEYIIIDGGSTDNTLDIIKKYDSRISYWISEPDKGQTAAINKGLKIATGEIINWLNSDDYYEPDALFKIAHQFTNNPNALIVSGRGRKFIDPIKEIAISKGVDIYEENLAKTIGWARMDQPETFFHRKVIEEIGLLNETLHYLMDRDWWIRFLFTFGLKGIIKTEDILVNFRLHQESKTVSQESEFQVEHDGFYYSISKQLGMTNFVKLIKDSFQVNEKYILQINPDQDKDFILKILNYHILNRAHEFYYQNNRPLAAILLNNVKPYLLDPEALKIWKKIRFRNTFVPLFILQLLRKQGFVIKG